MVTAYDVPPSITGVGSPRRRLNSRPIRSGLLTARRPAASPETRLPSSPQEDHGRGDHGAVAEGEHLHARLVRDRRGHERGPEVNSEVVAHDASWLRVMLVDRRPGFAVLPAMVNRKAVRGNALPAVGYTPFQEADRRRKIRHMMLEPAQRAGDAPRTAPEQGSPDPALRIPVPLEGPCWRPAAAPNASSGCAGGGWNASCTTVPRCGSPRSPCRSACIRHRSPERGADLARGHRRPAGRAARGAAGAARRGRTRSTRRCSTRPGSARPCARSPTGPTRRSGCTRPTSGSGRPPRVQPTSPIAGCLDSLDVGRARRRGAPPPGDRRP